MARSTSRNGKGAQKRARANAVHDFDALIRYGSAIVLIAAGVLLTLSVFGAAGPAGDAAFAAAYAVVGVGAFLLPLALLAVGAYAGFGKPSLSVLTISGVGIMLVSALAFAGLFPESGVGGKAGVWLGGAVAAFFGFWGTVVLLIAIAIIGFALVSDVEMLFESLYTLLARAWHFLRDRAQGRAVEDDEDEDFSDVVGVPTPDEDNAPEEARESAARVAAPREPVVSVFSDNAGASRVLGIANIDAEYDPPPLSLLQEDKGKPGTGDIKANANILKRTFQNFGIDVEMDEVSVGPTVTRYAVKPAEGVRLSKIVSLQGNLELALAAHPVRIEAPIPGKSLVGIEVPNSTKAMVGLGGLMAAHEWNESQKPLLAAIGRDIAGTPHYINIAKAPHALVAGATGSGKSVAIHALIASLLYRNGPNQLRFIMIDPKRVELTAYNGIPHLLTPVITEPKKAILSLKWAAKEMERRYNILEAEQVRDVDSYHKSVYEPAKKKGALNAPRSGASGDRAERGVAGELPEAMPYIVIVIDELADIMTSYPRELEAGIVRLAQMSRAVGIHLVLSTQRPSVNVITGLIKANIPTRLALQVASQIDSRTILDGSGAENLLGAGDMLYLSADMQKPVRLQTAFISEGEVKKVVSYIKGHNAGDLATIDMGGSGVVVSDAGETIGMFAGGMGDDDDIDDDLYDAAKTAVEEAGRASTSYLQRKLKIGYSRAARLMDVLESRGVIGPQDGSKPRQVLSAGGAAAPSEDAPEDVF